MGYLLPTPAGAYAALTNPDPGAAERMLMAILADDIDEADTGKLADTVSVKEPSAVAMLDFLFGEGFLTVSETPWRMDENSDEASLQSCLSGLLIDGRGLIASEDGLYLCCEGFTHEAAEELAAVCGSLSALYDRHRAVLSRHLMKTNRSRAGFGLIDAGGASVFGVWPLFLGRQRLYLLLEGIFSLNRPAFVHLSKLLVSKYV